VIDIVILRGIGNAVEKLAHPRVLAVLTSSAGPIAAMLPRSIRTIRSAIRNALASSWVTTTIVML